MGFPQTAILNALAVTNTQAEAINYILTTQLKEEDLPK